MYMMRATGLLFVPLLCVVLGVAGCHEAPTPRGPIAAQELMKRIAGGTAPAILDVRTPAEYAAGHIPGAVNIPHTELATRLAELPANKSTEIVVHCQGGGRAATAEKVLAEQGYTDVRDLEGHFGGWVQQGLPVEPAKAP
jgi:rhodanese-related sulfurtransferase